MRLTPEREKELREESKTPFPYEPLLQAGLEEAFEEIDALRAEIENKYQCVEEDCKVIFTITNWIERLTWRPECPVCHCAAEKVK